MQRMTTFVLAALLALASASTAGAAKTSTGGAVKDVVTNAAIGMCTVANNTDAPIAVTITIRRSGPGQSIGSRLMTIPANGTNGLIVPEWTEAWFCQFETSAPLSDYVGFSIYWTSEAGFSTVLDR